MDMDMSDLEDDLVITAANYIVSNSLPKSGSTRKPKRFYVRSYFQKRKFKGRFANDFQDLKGDPELFKETFRMSYPDFQKIQTKVEASLSPKAHSRKDSFRPEEKLMMTIEFLATGNFYRTHASNYRASKSSIGRIIEQTCVAIIKAMKDSCMPKYRPADWLEAANKFHSRWNLPNVLGAIDGKHIMLTCPRNAGSLFFSYKGFHSIVLMAVADAEYRFWYTDIGQYGSEGDSTVFEKSTFGRLLEQDKLGLPPDANIMGRPTPFFFLADDAFTFSKRVMKNYTSKQGEPVTENQDVFNYRMNRARRCVENAFGIMVARWMVLSRKMFLSPTRAQKVVQACCILHNFLLSGKSDAYNPPGFADVLKDDGTIIEGNWRNIQIPDSDLSGYPRSINARRSGRPPTAAMKNRSFVSVCEFC